MKKTTEILATIALFAIYIFYRTAHFFRITSKIKSFKYFAMIKPIDKWQERLNRNDSLWTASFYISIALVFLIGWVWTLMISTALVAANLIIFIIFRKKNNDRVY